MFQKENVSGAEKRYDEVEKSFDAMNEKKQNPSNEKEKNSEKIMGKDQNMNNEKKDKDKTLENNENLQNNEKKDEGDQDRVINKINEKLKNMTKEQLVKEYKKILKENEKNKNNFLKKEKESEESFDRYRRTLAEMENLRKRTITEKQDSLKYANFNIISDFIVVLDDFQRAIDSARTDEKMKMKNFVDGIEMIEKQFIDLLFKKYGVVKYGEVGDEFDPQIHSALMAEEGDYKKEVLLDVFGKGYSLHGRVARAAQVKIGKPKE